METMTPLRGRPVIRNARGNMRLLIVSHSCAQSSNQRLYEELQFLTGWEITLALPADWEDEFGNTLDQMPLDALGARARKIPVLMNGNIILHIYRQRWGKFLRDGRFNAIYVNHEPYALATAQVCWANLRQRCPAPFGFYSCQNITKNYPPPFSILERMVYRHSKFAFPITRAVAEVLRAKGYAGAATVCALPVVVEAYFPRGRDEDERLIPREPGQTVIGYVGRVVEAKGMRTLAGAMGCLSDLPWKLVVIGSGDFSEEFLRIMESHGLAGRVTFAGYVPHTETPRYLSAFDLLVLPSETQPNWKEQFGRAITEAMACGTAVVGSDSGEIPNLIRSSGGGLVFPERNVKELADALRTMMTDPQFRQKCAEDGKAWTLARVSLKGIAETMAATLDRAASPLR